MIPDRNYRRSVRRLRVCCWAASFGLFGLSLLTLDRFPVAAVLLGFLSIGALRLAAEVRREIDGWRQRDWQNAVWTYASEIGWNVLSYPELPDEFRARTVTVQEFRQDFDAWA